MLFAAKILSNTAISPGYWRIRLSAPPEFAQAKPGQFVMARVIDDLDPLLRRPLAIFDVGSHEENGVSQTWFEMLYRVVGKGTARLSKRRETDVIDILGPLGSGFDLSNPAEKTEPLLVGGAVGLVPLHLLAKVLVKRAPVRLFAGGRGRDDLLCLDDFKRLDVECHCATEDGSFGTRGRVTAPLIACLDALKEPVTLYACGPDAMLRALAKIADERKIPCQVSLEAHMACGVGACLGCVVPGNTHSPTTPDYRCVCAEGPVFRSSDLLWGD